jgi:glycosyltransferase involved in cell wall biosynthesis
VPAVSIVIPTYNHARFLHQALASVRAQTLADWEAIVVNNYSDDDTVEVVAGFADARIRLVNFRNHGVIAASRNEGIRQASGDLVAFLDSDDSWRPQKLARCVEAVANGLDLVCHGEDWISENAAPRRMFYGPAARATYASLLFNGNCISTSAVTVRRQALLRVGAFREEPRFVTAEDYDLWLRLASDGARIGFVREILGEYRIHDANASKALLRHSAAELAVVDDHFAALNPVGPLAQLRRRRRRALVYYGAGRGFQAAGDAREAWRWFGRSLLESPFILRLYAAAALNALAPLRRRPG